MTREEFLNNCTDEHLDRQYVEDSLDALLRAERKQTLERAAKAVCVCCKNENWPRRHTEYPGVWVHMRDLQCNASFLHALIADLPKGGTALPKGEPELGAETLSPGEVEP